MNQLAVSQAIQARGSTDALNPQFAVFALFNATIAERIAISAIRGLLRGRVHLALGKKKALCALEILLPASAALCAAFYACHGFLLVFCRDKTGTVSRKKRADAAGLSRIMLAGLKTRHYIGRPRPVTACLARFARLAPRSGAPQL